MGLPSTAIKAARLLRKREAASKLVRKEKQHQKKLIHRNDSWVGSDRYEKSQGPRRFSKGSRTKQARRDSVNYNKASSDIDEAEQNMHRSVETDRELETKTDWQVEVRGSTDFMRNITTRSGQHPAFKMEYLKWQKLSGG